MILVTAAKRTSHVTWLGRLDRHHHRRAAIGGSEISIDLSTCLQLVLDTAVSNIVNKLTSPELGPCSNVGHCSKIKGKVTDTAQISKDIDNAQISKAM
jgi:hypothetical protein